LVATCSTAHSIDLTDALSITAAVFPEASDRVAALLARISQECAA